MNLAVDPFAYFVYLNLSFLYIVSLSSINDYLSAPVAFKIFPLVNISIHGGGGEGGGGRGIVVSSLEV